MLNIVLASDENYVPYLSVCIVSLLENNINNFNKINLFLLENEIKDDSKEELSKLVNAYNANLIFIPTKKIEDIINNVPKMEKNNIMSYTTYCRLFISSLLPKNIDKVLYLDCDSIIVNPLNELWNIDVSNYSCGAVVDVANGLDFMKTGINMDKNDTYFNAGVLVINLKYWRDNNIEDKFINFLIKYKKIIKMHDQDIINNVLNNTIKKIHPKFNLMSNFHESNCKAVVKYEGMKNYYDISTLKEAQKNPVFVHLCGSNRDRPWANKHLKYRKVYEKYAKLTPFYDDIFIDEELTKKEFLKNRLYNSKLLYILTLPIPMSTCIKLAEKRKI